MPKRSVIEHFRRGDTESLLHRVIVIENIIETNISRDLLVVLVLWTVELVDEKPENVAFVCVVLVRLCCCVATSFIDGRMSKTVGNMQTGC